MKQLLLICLAASIGGCAAMARHHGAPHGFTSVSSPHSVRTTIDRFEAAAKARGLTIFARVDHAAGAQKIGQTLRPTELLIFGNPQGGTPLMQCAQTIGVDLPLRVLAWQDASGGVRLGYNEPRYLVHRHRAGECQPAVENVTRAVEAVVAEAVKP
jgi:uncharacterized protein (DUF302 family)